VCQRQRSGAANRAHAYAQHVSRQALTHATGVPAGGRARVGGRVLYSVNEIKKTATGLVFMRLGVGVEIMEIAWRYRGD
jgi:hypothetical protein